MGNCIAMQDPESKAAKNLDRSLSKIIRDDYKKTARQVKMLLLGAGESGKSTIFKQMKIIHNNGYSPSECAMYKDVIYGNIIESMRTLVAAAERLSIPIENPECKEIAAHLMSLRDEAMLRVSEVFTQKLAKDLATLWKDPAIQETYSKRNQFQLHDSTDYYMNSIERIADPGFVPNEQDVLRSRVRTTGIVEIEFTVKKMLFRMFDVGGQRNERKKWIHCFEGVTALIFVTSLSEYDQKCWEDDQTNRMLESLALFEEISNSDWFYSTGIIIFFNKVDLFKEKIQKKDLKCCFPDYQGGCDFDAASKFIVDKFLEKRCPDGEQEIYTHLTCATDTKNITTVFNFVSDMILSSNLRRHGI